MTINFQMLIDGAWTDGDSKERLSGYNPFDQSVWATIPQATDGDVALAIDAAHSAYQNVWRKTSGKERAELMHCLADLIEAKAEHLARTDSTDNGKVIRETTAQMSFVARNYRHFAGYADKLHGETIPLDNGDMFDFTLVEPLGVAVLITAWNSPLSLLANKLAPALATGNTVVIKPSEHASASTLEFGRLIEEAGFPAGVVNIVTGDGRIGNALTSHPKVRKISFTGGLSTARKILRSAADRVVPVTTELGGKSPNIIFEDANLSAAVTGAVAGVFGAAGQTCIAGSRLLVQRSVYKEVCDRIVEKAGSIRLGNPLDPATEMGPVANSQQYERILQMIRRSEKDGARIAFGGRGSDDPSLSGGYFIEPTVIVDVEPSLLIAREEVFGPVLCIIPFDTEEEALEIANDSEYGLAAGIWTNDLRRAHRMAREIEAGVVWINTYRASYVGAPFGGTKQSGHGRERSWHALLEYTQPKNVMIDLSGSERDPFAMKL